MAPEQAAAMASDSGRKLHELPWLYMDSIGNEFGPIPGWTMREWLTLGRFPVGIELRVRLPEWDRHLPLSRLYPDLSTAFVLPPAWPDMYSDGALRGDDVALSPAASSSVGAGYGGEERPRSQAGGGAASGGALQDAPSSGGSAGPARGAAVTVSLGLRPKSGACGGAAAPPRSQAGLDQKSPSLAGSGSPEESALAAEDYSWPMLTATSGGNRKGSLAGGQSGAMQGGSTRIGRAADESEEAARMMVGLHLQEGFPASPSRCPPKPRFVLEPRSPQEGGRLG